MTDHDNDDTDGLRDVRPILLDEDLLIAWKAQAKTLLPFTPAPALELADLDCDPCLHRIRRAAKAARYAATIATGTLKPIALGLAADLEAFVEAAP